MKKAEKTICFDLRFGGKRCGSSWARIIESNNDGMIIDCRQVMLDLDAANVRRSRRQSSYAFHENGDLVSARIKDHLGNRIAMEFEPGKMIIGDQSRSIAEPITFVLEQNMVALTVALLTGRKIAGDMSFVALLPETGTVLDFTIKSDGTGYRSNMGETFFLGPSGEIESVIPSASDFVFERIARKFPSWSLDVPRAVLEYRPPDHIRVQEKEFGMGGNHAPVRAATLARPKNKNQIIAAGVFVGGSGVYNRHGITAGFDIGYHQLLDDLAAAGIASIRYEKFDPRAANLEEAEGEQGFEDLCNQAACGLDWVSGQAWAKARSRIAIGHSLGGLVALALAGRANDLDAIVLLNTPGRIFRDVTRSQHGWFLQQSDTSAEATKESDALRRKLISALEDEAEWTPETVDGRILAFKRKRKLYRDILDLDPCALIDQGTCPIIIVQGLTDVQVSTNDAQILAQACDKAKRPCRLLLADGLDHLLKRNTETGFKALRNYRDRRRRIPVALIRQIAKAIGQSVPS